MHQILITVRTAACLTLTAHSNEAQINGLSQLINSVHAVNITKHLWYIGFVYLISISSYDFSLFSAVTAKTIFIYIFLNLLIWFPHTEFS